MESTQQLDEDARYQLHVQAQTADMEAPTRTAPARSVEELFNSSPRGARSPAGSSEAHSVVPSPYRPTDLDASMAGSIEEHVEVRTDELVEETIDRLSGVHGVQGVVLFDRAGCVLRTTFEAREAASYAVSGLALLQRSRELFNAAEDALEMVCVRSRKYELLVSGDPDGEYGVAVVQDPHMERTEPHGTRGERVGGRTNATAPSAP